MGEARQPRADRTLCLVIGRVAMPRADDHTMPHQRANILFVAQLGRERQHHAPAMRRGPRRQYFGIEPPDAMRFVNAALHLVRSEEHTSEIQSLMRTAYDVFCLHKK